jgi:hypothetical protein
MTVQIIKAPNGDDLVVLPKRDYDQLIRAAEEAAEDAADVAAYDAAMADPASRDPMPAAVSGHMLKGASLVKALRLWRGFSQAEVAEAAGLSQGFLSDLEARKRSRTNEVSRRLAKALDIPEHWLV